jgi:hypothetical protein
MRKAILMMLLAVMSSSTRRAEKHSAFRRVKSPTKERYAGFPFGG